MNSLYIIVRHSVVLYTRFTLLSAARLKDHEPEQANSSRIECAGARNKTLVYLHGDASSVMSCTGCLL